MSKIADIIAPVKKWSAKYGDRSVLDGYGWTIRYSHNEIKIQSQGYAGSPEDFRTVVSALQDYMEILCKKYAPDTYVEEEAVKRREL